MIPVTVHVPKGRLQDFYVRFAEYLRETPETDDPTWLGDGFVPSWIVSDEADALALKLWGELTLTGNRILTYWSEKARHGETTFTSNDLVALTQNPKGKSGVAGVLGGVGKAIRRAGLPSYRTPNGNDWHYLWTWDGEHYWMSPEVANLLIKASHKR